MAYRLFLLTLAAGLALGLLTARWFIELRPFTTVTEGSWKTVPTLGDFEATPYVKAYRAKKALMASTGRDTLVFTAQRDEAGDRLTSACTYSIAGRVTTAGWWSLRAESLSKVGVPQASKSLNSLTAVQNASGEILLLAAARPRPGNWLAAPAGNYALVLTLYDAPFARDALDGRLALPQIRKVDC